MKIVFFGLGSIGQKHAMILNQNYPHELFAFRTKKGQKKSLLPIEQIFSWDEFEQITPDIVFITNPTSLHIETAIKSAQYNCSLFIEKPLGSSLNKLDEMLNIIQMNNLCTYVAYNLRFHPIIKRLKEYVNVSRLCHLRISASSYLPNWRPDQDYKKTYSSRADMGGGVILDLSHEIDYVSYLMNGIESINGQFGRANNLTIDAEDYADILIKSKTCSANIHINFMSHYRERCIRADFPSFSIYADLITGVFRRFKKEKLIEERTYNTEMDQTFKKQLEFFFQNLDPKMMNNVFEAAELLKKVIKFKERGEFG